MVMVPQPEKPSSLSSEHGPNDSNPLFPAILAAVILCSILTTAFTAAGMITKRLISSYDLDDYVLMVAWVASIAFDFCLLAAGVAGFGHHSWNLQKREYAKIDKYAWALELLYILAIWLAKASLLFQQIRIFAPTKSGPVYWTCHVLIWGNLAFYISTFFAIIFGCHTIWPIREVWIQSYKAHCIDWKTLLVVSGAVNVLSDLLVLLLPVWTMWRLQMAAKNQIGIIAICATGLLAFVSSICRLVYTTDLLSSSDTPYILTQTALWGVAETTTIILCTSFPMMPRFSELIRDHYTTSKTSSSSPMNKVRKSRIYKVGHVQSSTGIGTGDLQEVDMAWLKSPYQQLGDEEKKGSAREDVIRDLGSKRTVGIEMATRVQLSAKSRVASIV